MTAESTKAGSSAPDICLVSMPYVSVTMPSMGLGLLKAVLATEDIDARVIHANLWFAEAVGLPKYQLCVGLIPMVFFPGEWTFAEAAFPDDPRREEKDAEFIDQIRQVYELDELKAGYKSTEIATRGGRAEAVIADLWAMRAAATRFAEDAARQVLATGARVVGCTSTFEQHVASLALLRRIRELDPDVVTMMGGANCETVMGEATHRCFPWVDYVVSGEADGIVGDLCRLVMSRGRDVAPSELPPGVLGPAHRQPGSGHQPGKLVRALYRENLDNLPTPRFDDYFETLAGLSLKKHIRSGIPMETSRGCWWGAVHHCTFCGLNGNGMGYRSKSAERVLSEMRELEERHQISDFEAVDNIMEMSYLKSLMPMLAAEGRTRRIFFEIKANMTRERLRDMRRAGITWVQPGIESLHTDVLRLMDKGIQGWQNVQLLKWCRELGLRLDWAILWGFPGEKPEWYEQLAAWLPPLEHLQPPNNFARIRFDRYSVYHEQARRYGLIFFPLAGMSLVYPLGPADLDDLASFFATEPGVGSYRYMKNLVDATLGSPPVHAVHKAVRAWRAVHDSGRGEPLLAGEDRDGVLEITDTRSCALSPRHTLTGLARAACMACDAAPRESRLAEVIARDFALTATDSEIAEVAEQLVADRLVLRMDGRLVGLYLPSDIPVLPSENDWPGGFAMTEDDSQMSEISALV